MRKKMSFEDKINKILKTNRLGISSASSLEETIGVSNGSITGPIRKEEDGGPKTTKRILEFMRINPAWWDEGEGDIYLPENDTGQMRVNESNQKEPDLNLLFIDTIKLLIEKNDRLVQDKQGEIVHLRGNENWFKEEFSKLTSKLGPSNEAK